MFDQEKINSSLKAMTKILTEALFSDSNRELITSICREHHLGDDRIAGVGRSVGYLLLGLIFPRDLATQIVKESSIDPRVALEIAKEIDHKIILPPLATELNRVYGFKMDVVDTPQPTISPTPAVTASISDDDLSPHKTSETIVLPIRSKPKAQTESPFVIHEHEQQQPILSKENIYPDALVHPSFYIPDNNVPDTSAEIPAAHLEIGINDPERPATTTVGKETAKVVHYAAPEPTSDPFSSRPTPPPVSTSKEVSPSNVVNLKDLPQ